MDDQYIFDRITVNPGRCNGKPTIRGTRITVATVLEFLGAGDTFQNVLEAYDFLEEEDLKACLRYAASVARHPC
jgi:uncharacterized protein (DUF433 family)